MGGSEPVLGPVTEGARLFGVNIDAALTALRREDPRLASDAEGALEYLTAGEGIEHLAQIELQEFLWYRLPQKFLTEPAHKRHVARALGRLLELLNLPRYAALCTSQETARVLAAYEDDHDARGRAAMRAAMRSSGVEPVDVEELTWSSTMGMAEASAYYRVARSLELAVAAAEFTPGVRGWKAAQQRFIRQQLLRARDGAAGRCLLDEVLEERIDGWLSARGTARQGVVGPLAGRLRQPSEPPSDSARCVAPVRWLLDQATSGLKLTQTHRLKPSTVTAMVEAFDWDDGIRGRRLEDDVAEVVATRDLTQRIHALRRSKLQLILTPTGRALTGADAALWRRLCAVLVATEAYDAAVQELALALMLQHEDLSRERLADHIHAAMTGDGWHSDDGRAPDERHVRWALVDFHWRLKALSLLEHDPSQSRWQDSWRLNAAGAVAAIEALKARATRPRSSPWEL